MSVGWIVSQETIDRLGGVPVVSAYVTAYAVMWVVTTVATYLAGRRLSFTHDQPNNPIVTSVFAGALWPIVVIGLLEAGMVGCLQAARRPETTVSWELTDIVTLP
jgi:hypothetical protein